MTAMEARINAAKEDPSKKYTYEQYYSWGEDAERCELIDGVIHLMSTPTIDHQSVVGDIFGEMWVYFRGRKCKPFIAPLDVRLNPRTLDDTVVQPDILVVCDPEKFSDRRNVQGAPDLVVEVLSKSTKKYDCKVKFRKYEQAGVREYWIVDPWAQLVQIFTLEDGRFALWDRVDRDDEFVESSVFEDMKIRVAAIFATGSE